MFRSQKLWLVIFLISLFPTIHVVAQSNVCTDALPPRLIVGSYGRVTPGNANNVRDTASRSGNLVGQIPGGERFEVLAGPTCADGLNWWQVRYGAVEGWTVEAVGQDYFLEAYDPNVPTVLTPTNEIEYEYEGIHFEIDPTFAAAVTASHIEPLVDDPNYDPPSPLAPAGIQFNFADANGDTLPLSLRVYSVADFKLADESAESNLNELSRLLTDGSGWISPDSDTVIPMLSTIEPPLLMRSRIGVLGFANGSGYRFLAQYSFDVHEIINPLEYRFSGITYDQQYYIIVEGQVTTPLLLDNLTAGIEFEERFEKHRTEVMESLEYAESESFKPNLNVLDNLIQSLQVRGEAYSVTTTDGLTTVKYGDMGFTLDSTLASDIDYRVDLASWETMSPMPEHVCFSLQDEPLSHEWSGKQVCIIPVEGMELYVESINQMLAEKPSFAVGSADSVYVTIPFNGAAQLIHANINFIETNTVRGIGFVSAYGQDDFPITANYLEYNFSGMTADEKYIIYFEIPVRTNLLPSGQSTDEEVGQVYQDPPKHYKSVEGILNAAAPSDFTPNLDVLTAVVKSIYTR